MEEELPALRPAKKFHRRWWIRGRLDNYAEYAIFYLSHFVLKISVVNRNESISAEDRMSREEIIAQIG